MRETLGTALLVLCLSSTAQAAEPSPVLGVGSESCAVWLRERATLSPQSEAHIGWVLGYVSAFNDFRGAHIIYHLPSWFWPPAILDGNWAVSRVNAYCAADPAANILQATDKLIAEQANALVPRSPPPATDETLGAGRTGCDRWSALRAIPSTETESHVQWALGFMTNVNLKLWIDPQIAKATDPNAITARIDSHCAAKPNSRVDLGTGAFLIEHVYGFVPGTVDTWN